MTLGKNTKKFGSTLVENFIKILSNFSILLFYALFQPAATIFMVGSLNGLLITIKKQLASQLLLFIFFVPFILSRWSSSDYILDKSSISSTSSLFPFVLAHEFFTKLQTSVTHSTELSQSHAERFSS